MNYEWKNVETGEIVTTDQPSIPPDNKGGWVRVFSFGVGRVEGAGGSPGRVTKSVKPGT